MNYVSGTAPSFYAIGNSVRISYCTKKAPQGCTLARKGNMSQATALGASVSRAKRFVLA